MFKLVEMRTIASIEDDYNRTDCDGKKWPKNRSDGEVIDDYQITLKSNVSHPRCLIFPQCVFSHCNVGFQMSLESACISKCTITVMAS